MKREPILIVTVIVVAASAISGVVGLPAWVYPVLAAIGVVGRQFVSPSE